MPIIQYADPQAVADLLTTQLNSLATATNSAASSAVGNNTDNYLFADFYLTVTFGSAPTAGNLVLCYFLLYDGVANYTDGSSSVTPATPADFSFPVRAVNTIQRIGARGIMLPPTTFQVLLRNESGQTMAASGNTLTYRRYNYESV